MKAPLAQPGLGVREGDCILAIDGKALGADTDIQQPLEATAGKAISLKVSGAAGPRDVTVVPVASEQRLRFVTLLSRAADEADLPDDPEFRAAVMGYAEWGTRLAVHNSGDADDIVEHAPVPRWGWGMAPPYQP